MMEVEGDEFYNSILHKFGIDDGEILVGSSLGHSYQCLVLGHDDFSRVFCSGSYRTGVGGLLVSQLVATSVRTRHE